MRRYPIENRPYIGGGDVHFKYDVYTRPNEKESGAFFQRVTTNHRGISVPLLHWVGFHRWDSARFIMGVKNGGVHLDAEKFVDETGEVIDMGRALSMFSNNNLPDRRTAAQLGAVLRFSDSSEPDFENHLEAVQSRVAFQRGVETYLSSCLTEYAGACGEQPESATFPDLTTIAVVGGMRGEFPISFAEGLSTAQDFVLGVGTEMKKLLGNKELKSAWLLASELFTDMPIPDYEFQRYIDNGRNFRENPQALEDYVRVPSARF